MADWPLFVYPQFRKPPKRPVGMPVTLPMTCLLGALKCDSSKVYYLASMGLPDAYAPALKLRPANLGMI